MTRITVARIAYNAHLLNHQCTGTCEDAQALWKETQADILIEHVTGRKTLEEY